MHLNAAKTFSVVHFWKNHTGIYMISMYLLTIVAHQLPLALFFDLKEKDLWTPNLKMVTLKVDEYNTQTVHMGV